MTENELSELVEAEQQLEQLLVATAEDGVPELALITILRDYADLVEDQGYVPRTWRQQ
ncbi:hypothetical protein [Haloarcula marina]|uniref:hypothetical protein n=1 Tax=Haloarcula marina TaxID=2961574 RepID=UPI0020B6E34A|nr:hypothetical protein [Halomicroarcula marina]